MKKVLSTLLCTLFSVNLFAFSNVAYEENLGTDISNFNFKLSLETVEFIQTNSNNYNIEIYTNNNFTIPSISKGKTLNISSSKHYFHIGDFCDIKIYLPKTTNLDNVSISTTSGYITAKELICSSKIELSSTSGNISVENLSAQSINIKNTSGNLIFNSISTPDLSIKTTSGDISLDNYLGEAIDVSTTSGRANLDNIDCDYFTIKSTSGNINIQLSHVPFASSCINTTSGNIYLFFKKISAFSYSYIATTGTLYDRINDVVENPHGCFKNEYLGGGTIIDVVASSGSFYIEN